RFVLWQVQVAQRLERLDAAGPGFDQAVHPNQQIDDRFRSQTGYRRAADMFDGEHQGTQDAVQTCALVLERRSPYRIVVTAHDGPAAIAFHANLHTEAAIYYYSAEGSATPLSPCYVTSCSQSASTASRARARPPSAPAKTTSLTICTLPPPISTSACSSACPRPKICDPPPARVIL